MISDMDKKKNFRSPGTVFSFGFLGLFVILFIAFNLYFGFGSHPVFCPGDVDKFKWGIYWRMSSVFLVVVMVGCYLFSLSVVRRNYSGKMKTWGVSFCFLLLAIAFFLHALTEFRFDVAGDVGVYLQEQIQIYAEEKDSAHRFATEARELIRWVLEGLVRIEPKQKISSFIKFLSFMGTAVFIVIAFSSYSIMRNKDKELSMRITKVKDIYSSLYSSSVLLAVGVMEVFCLYQWAAQFGDGKISKAVADAVSIDVGLFFSALLLLVYLPLLTVRNELIGEIVMKKAFQTKQEMDDWFSDNGIRKNIGGRPFDLMAFILPVVTGVAVNILSK